VKLFYDDKIRKKDILLDLNDIKKHEGMSVKELSEEPDYIEHLDKFYGGHAKNKEKYNLDNIQKMLNNSMSESKSHFFDLNKRSNGGLKKLLIEMGCIENADLKQE
jgi:predicted RNA-binding protein with RPS1 domain